MTALLDPPAYRRRWLTLVAVLVAEVMDLIDATVVGIAAPSITRGIGGGEATIQWIAAGYTLAYAAGLITGGRLGDLWGRRRMFLLGLTGFVVMSTLCGLAPIPGLLIAARVLQGLFGAVLIPQGFGILKSTFPPREQAAAFGAFGPAIGLSVVAAPVLGGALIYWDLAGAGWRAVFLINVPIGLAGLALALAALPESRADDRPRPDPVGMLLVSTGLTLLVFPLVQGRELALSLYLQLGLHATPLLAGLAQAPWAVGIAVGSALSAAALAPRFGRATLQAGVVVMAAGIRATAWTITTVPAVTGWTLAPALLVTGLGMGLHDGGHGRRAGRRGRARPAGRGAERVPAPPPGVTRSARALTASSRSAEFRCDVASIG